MNFSTYDSMRKLISKPHKHYTEHMQALINDRWDNSTQNSFNVWQEIPFASGKYEKVDVSIDTAVEIGTGFKKGEDFKVFSHRDISHEVQLGTMFKTDSDYWICINTNAFASPVNSCEVRRCNNTLKWINPDNGYVYEQWCVIDYELSKPQPLKDKNVVVASGHIVVIVQGNELTRSIQKNQRFIFNGQPYKLASFQTMLDDHANQSFTNLIYMDMYLDLEKASDDMRNMVADAYDYQYDIDIIPDFTEQVSGFTGKMRAVVYLNGEIVDRIIEWSSSDNVEIDNNGNYTLVGEAGSNAYITATLIGEPIEGIMATNRSNRMINNNEQYFKVYSKPRVPLDFYDGLIKTTQPIKIVEEVQDNYSLVINPLFSDVRLNNPQSFDVYLYNNGIRQEDEITVVASGLSSEYYELIQDEHNFVLSARTTVATPLILTFTSGGISKTIEVFLKSFF